MKYSLHNYEELLEFAEKNKGKLSYQLPDNYAYIYLLPNGNVCLFPQAGANHALFFENETMMHEVLEEEGRIPVDDPHPNPFQKEQQRITNLDIYTPEIIGELGSFLEIELRPEPDKQHLAKVSAMIRKKMRPLPYYTDRYEKYYFKVGIFNHEIIRRMVNGKWYLQTQRAINSYFVPAIIDAEETIFESWKPVLDGLDKLKYFDIVRCIDSTLITNPLGRFSFDHGKIPTLYS